MVSSPKQLDRALIDIFELILVYLNCKVDHQQSTDYPDHQYVDKEHLVFDRLALSLGTLHCIGSIRLFPTGPRSVYHIACVFVDVSTLYNVDRVPLSKRSLLISTPNKTVHPRMVFKGKLDHETMLQLLA